MNGWILPQISLQSNEQLFIWKFHLQLGVFMSYASSDMSKHFNNP